MQARQQKLIESYQRVKVFLEANPASGTPGFAEAKAGLDAVVAQLTDHSTAQVSGRLLTKAERQRVTALMKRLKEQHMRPIATIAKAASDSIPGLIEELKMPRHALGALRLVAAARAMRGSAATYAETFVRAGRPQDFLERFDAAIVAVQDALGGHARTVGRRVGANAGLTQQLQRGRLALDVLDPIVKMAFEGNEVVLAQWRAAKRVRGVPGVSGTGAGDEPAPAITPSATQPTAA